MSVADFDAINLLFVRKPGRPLGQPHFRLLDDVIHHFLQIAGLFEHAASAGRRRCPSPSSGGYTRSLRGSQFVYHVVHELQILENQSRTGTSFCLPKSIILPLMPVARRAPLILHDQRAPVQPKALVCARTACRALPPSPGSAPRARWSRPRASECRRSRNSRVWKNGCGRMSHQIFLALSMQLVLMSSLTKFSYSP